MGISTAESKKVVAQRLVRIADAVTADEIHGFRAKEVRLLLLRKVVLPKFGDRGELPDSAIMEILGWSSIAMLQRYLGKIPVAQLKRYPTTLERICRAAV